MPYPPRAQLRPDPAVQAQMDALIVEQYAAGRSLRELSELTDRSFSAVRHILDKRGVRRRDWGAASHRERYS